MSEAYHAIALSRSVQQKQFDEQSVQSGRSGASVQARAIRTLPVAERMAWIAIELVLILSAHLIPALCHGLARASHYAAMAVWACSEVEIAQVTDGLRGTFGEANPPVLECPQTRKVSEALVIAGQFAEGSRELERLLRACAKGQLRPMVAEIRRLSSCSQTRVMTLRRAFWRHPCSVFRVGTRERR